MARLGKGSMKALSTCHPDLQLVARMVITYIDFKVIVGHRGRQAQNRAYNAKPQQSKLKFPEGKHNKKPSEAFDLAPYPIDWDDTMRFIFLAGFILMAANVLGIRMRWGGDWDSDTQLKDNRFNDMGHFEVIP